MNIFLRELRANLKSLIIWSVIVFLFIVVGFSKFSAFFENPELLAIIDSMPPALVAAFDMNAASLTTVTGFFALMMNYFSLLLSIAAAMWGSDIIAKEERDRTVEFALTLPVTRTRLVTAKIAAALVNCMALLGVTWAATLSGAQSYKPTAEFYPFVTLGMLSFLVLQVVFLAVGALMGSAARNHKQASSLSVSILLGAFVASVISGLSKDLEFLKYFSPFEYFDTGLMLSESRLDAAFVALAVAIAIACLAAAYAVYRRRDLYI